MLEQFLVLTATFSVCTLLSHTFYVLVARGMKRGFSDVRRVRLFNRISGGAFVALGLGMLRLRQRLLLRDARYHCAGEAPRRPAGRSQCIRCALHHDRRLDA
ncbi:hypothetical protein ACU4GD_40565 [Cupriavidus basilensis]